MSVFMTMAALILGWACAEQLPALPDAAPRSDQAARLFTSTFREIDSPETRPYAGLWRSPSGSMALVPRPGVSGLGLFGAIPSGRHDGALWLSRFEGSVWHGRYASALTGNVAQATLSLGAGGQTVRLAIGGDTLTFQRVRGVRLDRLATIAIVGHRGASLGRSQRENTLAAVADSWLFGSSGVELDVTIPHDAARRPLPAQMRVHHPSEWRSEITGFDSTAVAALADAADLRAAMRSAVDAGLSVVYLDPKLRWLVSEWRDAAREALTMIVSEAAATPQLAVVIGAETSGAGEAADMLAAMRHSAVWPTHLRWALEITRGTDVTRAAARLAGGDASARPDAVSWNLLRVTGGGGGWLRLFVRPVAPAQERSVSGNQLPLVVWTANDDSQFTAALTVLARLRPRPSDVAIITPHPHRLAYHLATLP